MEDYGVNKRKIWTKAASVIVIAAVWICLIRCHFNYERRISRFVMKYETELTELSETYLAAEPRERRLLFEEWKKENGHNVQLTGLFPEEVVAFYVGGFGLAPSSVYYGFYYSPEDIPISTGEGKLKLSDKEAGQNSEKKHWSWQGYGDNGGEIVKIKEHWYYYKCWF